jgi:hypothetical protein
MQSGSTEVAEGTQVFKSIDEVKVAEGMEGLS